MLSDANFYNALVARIPGQERQPQQQLGGRCVPARDRVVAQVLRPHDELLRVDARLEEPAVLLIEEASQQRAGQGRRRHEPAEVTGGLVERQETRTEQRVVVGEAGGSADAVTP